MVKSRPLISIAHCTEKERVGSMSLPIQSTQSSSSAGRSAGNGASAGQAMPLASPAPSEGEEKKKKVTSSAYFLPRAARVMYSDLLSARCSRIA